MKTVDPELLNQDFAIAEHVTFTATEGGVPVAEILNKYAAVSISVQGGHVIEYQPHGQPPVVWVSRLSAYTIGKPIRGGIPVCWPWFGAHPNDPLKPMHGFARTAMWQVVGAGVGPGDATQLRLGLTDSAATWELWPHAFQLDLIITVGQQLGIELIARNPGEQPYTCGGALHTYFGVGDVTKIAIQGLEGRDYFDKADAFKRKTQSGPVTIAGETDRIYLATTSACVIDDPVLERQIQIDKAGSLTTVVWNPWREKAAQLADFGDDEYMTMVCVETANADQDVVTIAPGGEHRLSARIGVKIETP